MKTDFICLADRHRQDGRQEELERNNRTAAKNMVRKGFEVSVICAVLDVTPEFVER